MHRAKLIEEITRHAWAITEPALDAILSVVDGEDLSDDKYALFHARAEEQRVNCDDQFGKRVPGSYYSSIDNGVGYMMIDGPIIPRATLFSDVSGMVSVSALTSEFMALQKNPSVHTIALLMDSPGGAVTGISDFASLVRASEKPTIGFTWMAASAAYWIVAATDTIVSSETGIVGSIGAVMSMVDTTEADRKKGIRTIEIVSSQSPFKRVNVDTPEGYAVKQKFVDDLAEVFVGSVAMDRGVSREKVLSDFGQGGLKVAAEAASIGMVDKVMSLGEFIAFTQDRNNQHSFAGGMVSRQASISAEAEEKTEKIEMEKTPEQIAAEEKAMNEKIAAAKLEAAEGERARIKAIESLNDGFASALPSVKEKVSAEIDRLKFEDGATPESVSMKLLPIVAIAQVGSVEDAGKGRREASAIAGKINANAPEDNAGASEVESKGRVNKLVEAHDSTFGKVGE
jgi:ClpP class serine protease